jgi:hypothetical protein
LAFEENAIFFRRKLSKIAENCDHNIDLWSEIVGSKTFHKKIDFVTFFPDGACTIVDAADSNLRPDISGNEPLVSRKWQSRKWLSPT